LFTCELLFQSARSKCVDLVQRWHHHLIECSLFSPSYSWKLLIWR